MLIFDSLLDGDQDDANFVGSQNVGGTSSAILSSLGAVAGHIAIILTNGSSPSSAGGGTWNLINAGSPVLNNIFWKVLNSSDVSSAVSLTSNGAINWRIAIFSVASSVQLIVSDSGLSHLNTVSGIVRGANHAGLVGFVVSQDGGGGVITAPASWSAIGNIGPFGAGGHIYQTFMLSRLAPPNQAYINGSSFTYGDAQSDGGGFKFYLTILELRR